MAYSNISHHIPCYEIITENALWAIKKDDDLLGYALHCLYIAAILDLPSDDRGRCEFIDYGRRCYMHNDIIQQIDKFENEYQAIKAIEWYTQTSGFPNRFVNETCRTLSMARFFKIRYYLKNIHIQLEKLHSDTVNWVPPVLPVYRGEVVSLELHQKLSANVGQRFLTTAFLSTTCSRKVADMFCASDQDQHQVESDKVSVIYTILISTKTTQQKAFVDIQDHSTKKYEYEILMPIGTLLQSLAMRKREASGP
ncbi:unnamed protein product [Adineta steineri]|uniref:Uncharacterized protein n=1 Tax=Adineta steineri TaxID=433720 RepID=A0A819WUK9_9BILA|nr:unnamed protein product [Adineta steineri]CAF4127896.1 unnamed protein product [Adineta steineri]